MFKRFIRSKDIMTRILLSLNYDSNIKYMFIDNDYVWDFTKNAECLIDYLIIEDTKNQTYCILKANKEGQLSNVSESEISNLSLEEYYYKEDQRVYSLENCKIKATLFSNKKRYLVYFKTNSIRKLNNDLSSRYVAEWIKFFPCMREEFLTKNES